MHERHVQRAIVCAMSDLLVDQTLRACCLAVKKPRAGPPKAHIYDVFKTSYSTVCTYCMAAHQIHVSPLSQPPYKSRADCAIDTGRKGSNQVNREVAGNECSKHHRRHTMRCFLPSFLPFLLVYRKKHRSSAVQQKKPTPHKIYTSCYFGCVLYLPNAGRTR